MGNNDIFMARHAALSPYRVRHSDMGYQMPIGAGDAIAKSLYCGMKPIGSWTSEVSRCLPTGGIFNLEFSPEGSLLVAACEKRVVQIFDPLTHKKIHSVDDAHLDCVNCVKFLDPRMFATCSDDTTIALWDVRNLRKKIRSLSGHSKWVKNIEFSAKDRLLVTSGLDGSIHTWDINSYTESNLVHQRVFHTSSLMRCRLSPDARQMVMSTTGGLLVIIHDLNLETLANDLHGFKPNLYRLMQMSNQVIPVASQFDYLFDSNRKSNRVEFVSDFPLGNDAEVVSALQIHPQGWTALSRNISNNDKSEWTCIHDIQRSPASRKDTRSPSPPRAPRRAPAAARRRMRARPCPYRPVIVMRPDFELNGMVPPEQIAFRAAPRGVRAAVAAEAVGGGAAAAAEEEEPLAPAEDGEQPQRRRHLALVTVDTVRMRGGRMSTIMVGGRLMGGPGGAGGSGETPDGAGQGPGGEGQGPGGEDQGPDAVGQEPDGEGQGLDGEGQGPDGAGQGPDVVVQRPGRARRGAGAAAAPRIAQGLQNDLWEATITLKQHRLLQDVYNRGQVRPNFNMQRISGINSGLWAPQQAAPAPPSDNSADRPSTSGHSPLDSAVNEEARSLSPNHSIRHNEERLLYYIEETNEGKGFIKELCYSADGRIVCSPFGRGMRLLALNDSCSELSQCVTEEWAPKVMVEVGQSLGVHQDLVVSSRFSPRHHLLVTGCLEGKIVWYQPHSGEV